MLKGITSSTGVAMGKILLMESVGHSSGHLDGDKFDMEYELRLFDEALVHSRQDLEKLQKDVLVRIGREEEGIFEAQSLILEDPAIVDEVMEKIKNENMFATQALSNTINNIEKEFLAIEDKTIRQRIADVKDVGSRIMRWLKREKISGIEGIIEPIILVAEDILPSQAALMDKETVMAIVTEKGGINSHASIIARSLDIPAVVGVKGIVEKASASDFIIVDGYSGVIYIDPDKKTIGKYENIIKMNKSAGVEDGSSERSGVILSACGEEVYVYANVGRQSELNRIRGYGVEGVGILRTEFLLMNRQEPPSVEDFVNHFRTILEFMNPKPVNIRLLDLGGDKTFPYLTHPKESNPALGERGIRYLLSNIHLLKDQIKAIILASPGGNPIVQIPMITTVQEIREVKKILRQMEMEMNPDGKQASQQIPLGIMIETPAAAILSPLFASEVDYISIGTNDLTQYTLASDRENEHVQSLYNCLNPAVLSLISTVASAGAKEKVPVSVCGEMAADIRAIPILLGMGIRRLSVGTGRIQEVRDIIRKISISSARRLALKALKTCDVIEVEKLVNRFLRKMEKSNVDAG